MSIPHQGHPASGTVPEPGISASGTEPTNASGASAASVAPGAAVPVALLLQSSALPPGIDPADLPVAEVVAEPAAPVSEPEQITSPPVVSEMEKSTENVTGTTIQSTEAPSVAPSVSAADTTALAAPPEQTPGAASSVSAVVCPACGTQLDAQSQFCYECGYAVGSSELQDVPLATPVWPETVTLPQGTLVANRDEIVAEISRRPPTVRYRAIDRANENRGVVLVQQRVSADSVDQANIQVGRFRLPAEIGITWPALGWEIALLEQVNHPCWPRVLDVVQEGHEVFGVEEAAEGPDLWQVFDDPALTMPQRFELLAQWAEGMKSLVQAGAIPEYFK
ncbi:MAG: hypothetical protein RMJ19_12515, partial [Gemmatales bacterium]|nr:hypothetical protein [Gemmatales bacterium]MDW8176489.1 hypothetical protein [Gemmatales bacterium]